jgi:hypothetical protein
MPALNKSKAMFAANAQHKVVRRIATSLSERNAVQVDEIGGTSSMARLQSEGMTAERTGL